MPPVPVQSRSVNPEKHERKDAYMTIFKKVFGDSNGTPIVSSIRALMGLDDSNVENPNVLVLDYRRDQAAFKALWALDKNNEPTKNAGEQLLTDLAGANKMIVLVDVDASTVISSDKFGRHLSALSWAHCLTHSLWLAKKAAPNISILDLRTETSVHQDATFTDVFNLPSSKTPENIRRFGASLSELEEFILHITKNNDEDVSSFGDIATFVKRWKFALVEADSRSTQHDLNNTMGPLWLAASVANDSLNTEVIAVAEDANDRLARAAMLRAMQWVATNGANSSPFQPLQLNVARDLRILLLDDQAKDGWLPVLSHYLGLTPLPANVVAPTSAKSGFKQFTTARGQEGAQVSLWFATSPDLMMCMLDEAAVPAKQKVARLRFTQDIPSVCNADFDELLLLDLRLYGGPTPAQVEAEMNFLNSVVAALAKTEGYAQPTSCDRVAVEGFRETPAYLQALTGVARLISAVDFSYPIVMWSSTGQRKVTECLREFKNVFTGLEKPRFDSYMSNTDDLRIALNDAYLWARKKIEAASFFYELMKLNETPAWEPPSTTHPYVEIYIEEDGDTNKQQFKVGALIAFYKDASSAEQLHSDMHQPHFGASLIHENDKNRDSFSTRDAHRLVQPKTTLAFSGENRLPKKLSFSELNKTGQKGFLKDTGDNEIADPRNNVALKLNDLLKRYDAQCMMITSTLRAATPQKEVDPRYLFLLSDVLRLALTFFMTGKEVRVFVATKRQKVTSATDQEAKDVARNYFEKWGVLSEVKKTSTSYSSLNNHSALHAAIDAHSYSDGIDGQARLCGARGVTLSYKKANPRPAHYEWQIFENIFQAKSGPNAAGRLVRAELKISGNKGDQILPTSGDALLCSFPHSISNKNSWRALHYYADEMLEKSARKAYLDAGVVTIESWFDRCISSDDPNKDSQLLILSCGRSTLQGNLSDAIKSYASSALNAKSSSADTDGNRKLRDFIGKRLASKLADNKESAKVAYETVLDVTGA